MSRLLEILQSMRPEIDFREERSIVTDGLIDSFDLVTLVSDLDEAYSISIDGEDIVPENFENIEEITNLLKKYDVVP